MFREVPALGVVAPLAAVVLVALLWSLRRRGRLTAPRAAVAVALCVYVAGVVANTVFPIYLEKPFPNPAWSKGLALAPLTDYEAADAITNSLIFVPLGMLTALLLPRAAPWWRAVAVGAALSLAIEATQYVTAHLLGGGHIADTDDFLSNVVGAAVGVGLLAALTRAPRVAALVDRFRWR